MSGFGVNKMSILNKKKKYKVVINFQHDKNSKSMEVKVNGKDMPIPPKLKHWIAEEYIRELFWKINR